MTVISPARAAIRVRGLRKSFSLVVVVGVALLIGFRSGAGLGTWLAVAGILALLTLALTWLAVTPGG